MVEWERCQGLLLQGLLPVLWLFAAGQAFESAVSIREPRRTLRAEKHVGMASLCRPS